MVFVFQNLQEHDINNLYLQYSFVFIFTNIFLTIRQDWYSLLNHCLRPHTVFSFTNNNPFYQKQYCRQRVQSLLPIHNSLLLENNSFLPLLLENNSLLLPTYCLGDRSRSLTLLPWDEEVPCCPHFLTAAHKGLTLCPAKITY